MLSELILFLSLVFNPWACENQILTWICLLVCSGIAVVRGVERIPRELLFVSALLCILGFANSPNYANTNMGLVKLGLSLFCLLLGSTGSLRVREFSGLIFGYIITIRGIMDLFLPNLMRGWDHTMTSFYCHKNMFGYILIPLFWWILYGVTKGTKKYASLNIARHILLGLVIFCFLNLNSRSAQLGWVFSIALFLAISFLRQKQKTLLPLVLLPFLLLPLSSFIGGNSIISEVQKIEGYKGGRYDYPGSGGIRLELWRTSIESWKNSPLLGNGEGSIEYAVEQCTNKTFDTPNTVALHAHSHYLEMLHDRGLIGFGIEFLLICLAVCGYYKARDELHLFWLSALIGLSIQNVFAEASEYPSSVTVWWLILGYGVGLFLQNNKRKALSYFASTCSRCTISLAAILLTYISVPILMADHFLYLFFSTSSEVERIGFLIKAGNWGARSVDYGFNVANAFARKGDFKAALAANTALEKDAPGFSLTKLQRAKLHFELGEYGSTILVADTLLKRFPNSIEIQQMRLESLGKIGNCNAFRIQYKQLQDDYDYWLMNIKKNGKLDPGKYDLYPDWVATLLHRIHPNELPESTLYISKSTQFNDIAKIAATSTCSIK